MPAWLLENTQTTILIGTDQLQSQSFGGIETASRYFDELDTATGEPFSGYLSALTQLGLGQPHVKNWRSFAEACRERLHQFLGYHPRLMALMILMPGETIVRARQDNAIEECFGGVQVRYQLVRNQRTLRR